jgi:hypothetical protein
LIKVNEEFASTVENPEKTGGITVSQSFLAANLNVL